ncbi:uncharacterized protein LOC132314277 [Cornus florida]|uniref:uncharacterized protein LOC132314277 n=1 Tax=Cornus florida TaxID=4283 RepID=UPI00289D4359|nr:uncharacterized protein LOC132314277 [Cornus florida]
MQLLVKPWPFRGWAMDLIGKINPPSSKGHHWFILATDYFTEWVEAEEYVLVTHNTVIQFLERHIFHRFGLPETIVVDNGSVFRANEVLQLGIDIQVKMVTSTPYYAQRHGQTEALNKVVIEIIEKMIKAKLRRWHEALSEALWAYRNSKRIIQKLALDHLMVHKAKVMRAYNKRVKFKSFAEGDIVWQTILPPGKVDRVYGKWSPTWKGLYLVHQVLHGGAYMLKDLDGEIHERPINGRYLKKYKPTIFELMEEKKIPVSQDSVDCMLCKVCRDKICSCDE